MYGIASLCCNVIILNPFPFKCNIMEYCTRVPNIKYCSTFILYVQYSLSVTHFDFFVQKLCNTNKVAFPFHHVWCVYCFF